MTFSGLLLIGLLIISISIALLGLFFTNPKVLNIVKNSLISIKKFYHKLNLIIRNVFKKLLSTIKKILDRLKNISLTNYLLFGIIIMLFLGFYFSFSGFRFAIDDVFYKVRGLFYKIEVKDKSNVTVICEKFNIPSNLASDPDCAGLKIIEKVECLSEKYTTYEEKKITTKEIINKFLFIPYSRKDLPIDLELNCNCKQEDYNGQCI